MARHNVELVTRADEHLRYMARTEAEKLVSTGEAIAVCRNCGRFDLRAKRFCGAHGKSHSPVYMVTALYRNIHTSATTLTLSDTLANLGLSRRDETSHGISNGKERAAQLKIKLWPTIHDTKAVLVCPA